MPRVNVDTFPPGVFGEAEARLEEVMCQALTVRSMAWVSPPYTHTHTHTMAVQGSVRCAARPVSHMPRPVSHMPRPVTCLTGCEN